MWIRSQKKDELIEVSRVKVNSSSVCTYDKGILIPLGFYKDSERAVAVLNEIQSSLIKGTKFDKIDRFGERIFRESVYEMPQS